MNAKASIPSVNKSNKPTNQLTMSGNPVFALLWAVLLFFIAWPVAGICAGLWLLLVRDRSSKFKFGGRMAAESQCQSPMQKKLMPTKTKRTVHVRMWTWLDTAN